MPRAHAGACLGVQGGEPLLNAKYAPCDIRDMKHLDLMDVCDDEQSICLGAEKRKSLWLLFSSASLALSAHLVGRVHDLERIWYLAHVSQVAFHFKMPSRVSRLLLAAPLFGLCWGRKKRKQTPEQSEERSSETCEGGVA